MKIKVVNTERRWRTWKNRYRLYCCNQDDSTNSHHQQSQNRDYHVKLCQTNNSQHHWAMAMNDMKIPISWILPQPTKKKHSLTVTLIHLITQSLKLLLSGPRVTFAHSAHSSKSWARLISFGFVYDITYISSDFIVLG